MKNFPKDNPQYFSSFNFPGLQEELIYDFAEINDVKHAEENGLVAVGGNLSFGTLINAYSKGIFPWFNPGEVIQWFSPDPRFVLFPQKLKVSHSMRNVFNKKLFRLTVDQDFNQVLQNCRHIKRAFESGSWIGDEIEIAYKNLFEKGISHSAEAWKDNELVGGLYGVLIGKVFFGESMFSKKSNASKFAFISFIKLLEEAGIELIDCQVYSGLLQSLGAEFISRKAFNELLKKWIPDPFLQKRSTLNE